MKKFRVSLIVIFFLIVQLAVSGCTSLYDKNLGTSVDLNESAQVIDASAINADQGGPTAALEGQKAEKLMSRYRKEEAEAPTEKLLKDIGD